MGKVIRIMFAGMMAGMMATAPAMAQEGTGKKTEEDIIIRRNGETKEKMTIVIDGDKVTINGKPSEDFKSEEVIVMKRRNFSPFDMNFDFDIARAAVSGNKAILGVVTEKTEEGAKVNSVSKNSGAEKAGLKEGDVITAINDKKVTDSETLVKLLAGFKPEDKVTVHYKRDGKANKTSATLGKRETSAISVFNTAPNLRGQAFGLTSPRVYSSPEGRRMTLFPSVPKIGMSVQDTEEGKGVKVTDVDEGSAAATAGIKENDVILSFDEKEVNGATELSRMVKEAQANVREKRIIAMKINRGGKTVNTELKIPVKLNSADL